MSLLWARHCEKCFLCSFNPHTLEVGLSFIPILLKRNPRFGRVTQSLISKPEFLANCHLSSPMENALPFSLQLQAESSFTWSRIQRHPRGAYRPCLLEPDCCRGTVRLHTPHSASDRSSPVTAHHDAQWTIWPKRNKGAVTEANAQGSQSSCSDHSVDVKVETVARRGVIQCHLPTMLVGRCRDPERGHQGPYL